MTILIILGVIAIVFAFTALGKTWTEPNPRNLRIYALIGWICVIIWIIAYLIIALTG